MNNGEKKYEQDRQLAKLARVKRVASFLFRTGLFLLVAVGVTMIVCYVIGAEYPMPIIFIAAGVMFACLFGGMIVGSVSGNKAKQIAVEHTPIVLKQVMDKLESYEAHGGVGWEFLDEELGLPSYDRIGGCGDHVKGVIRGIPIEFNEFYLEEERTERDEDGDTRTYYSTVFSGLIAICKHDKELACDVTVSQITRYIGSTKTESEDFNKAFSTRAESDLELFRLLTPQYMERLMQASGGRRGLLSLCFKKDGTLYLVIRNLDLFEANGASSTEELQKHIEGEVHLLGDILETLQIPNLHQ